MKKLFPDEKGTKRGVKEFLDKKGFYIVLLLCIAVVAGTAVFVTTRNATSVDPEYNAGNIIPGEEGEDDLAVNEADWLNAQQTEDTAASAGAQAQTDIGKPVSSTADSAIKPKDGTTAPKDDTAAPKDTAVPSKTSAPKGPAKSTTPAKQQSFKMPVNGNISLEFAMDKLVYSKTLEEWRAHKGVDIASDRGTPVKAVADGVISDVKNDPHYGISVIIDHGNGLESLYRNLASDEIVAVNQKVKQGEVIGSIGNTAMDESSEQPHLHFEVLKDNVNVDPMTYLPQSTEKVD